MPNKLLGQNFLKNPAILKKIAAAVDISAGDFILEIGPGHGELTDELCVARGERQARIIAIEKDKTFVQHLEEKFKDSVEIVSGDILEELPVLIHKLLSAADKFKIVGNIPYYLTGHLLRIISELDQKPERCVFLVQKEVAERIIAEPPRMNRLAASVQVWSEPKIALRVPRKDFYPQPKVDSAVILLEKRREPIIFDLEKYYAAVRAIFAQPRKTILNNLMSYEVRAMSYEKEKIDKDELAIQLQALGLDPMDRPQNLSIQQIALIADTFFVS